MSVSSIPVTTHACSEASLRPLGIDGADRQGAPSPAWLHDHLFELSCVLIHEARGSLTAIHGWAQTLELDGQNPATAADAASALQRSVEAQSDLFLMMEEILDFTRETSTEPGDTIDFALVVERVAERAAINAASRGVELTLDLDPRARFIQGRESQISRVVSALLLDAIKHSPLNGKVDVSLRLDGPYSMLAISDSGPPLNANPPELPFERLRRNEGTQRNDVNGIVLHLTYARAVVESLGGYVTARSSTDPRATTFAIWIPSNTSSPESVADAPLSGVV